MSTPQTSRPRFVAFEVTTRCNLDCVMCPHGINAVREPRDAEPRLLETLWPAMRAADTVHLNGVGEPLLAEAFWTVVRRLAGRSRPRIDFNTNGLLLSEANLALLAKAPLGRVYVSVDAATEKSYRRIRGGSFDKVMAQLKRAAAAIGPPADLRATFVIMRENFAEILPFVDLMARQGVPAVNFAVLTEPGIGTAAWQVRRPDGWQFDYRPQMIQRSDPDLVAALRQAVRHGASRGVSVECFDSWGWA